MCAKPEPVETYRPLADLIPSLNVEDFAWAGVRVFCALVESA